MVVKTLRHEGHLKSLNNVYVNYSMSVLISIGLGLTVHSHCVKRAHSGRTSDRSSVNRYRARIRTRVARTERVRVSQTRFPNTYFQEMYFNICWSP